MPPKHKAGGCPCCATACTFGSDDFDRASLGSDWTQQSGTTTIDTIPAILGDPPYAKMTGANTITLWNTDQPDDEPDAYVSIDYYISDAGNSVRVYFAWKDSNNYCYAELLTGTPVTLSIVQVSGGTPSTLDSLAGTGSGVGGGWKQMEVAYCWGILTASCQSLAVAATVSLGTGESTFGFGTGAMSTGYVCVDNWLAQVTYWSNGDPCRFCGLTNEDLTCCGGVEVPTIVQVVLSGTGLGGCDGTYFVPLATVDAGCLWEIPSTGPFDFCRPIQVTKDNTDGSPWGGGYYGGSFVGQTGSSCTDADWDCDSTGTMCVGLP